MGSILSQHNSKTDRYYKHQGDFRDRDRKTSTELSSYIWELKKQSLNFDISWEIVRRANPFSPITRRCDLCIAEKMEIVNLNINLPKRLKAIF